MRWTGFFGQPTGLNKRERMAARKTLPRSCAAAEAPRSAAYRLIFPFFARDRLLFFGQPVGLA
jgi:hypothetical protein